RGADGYRHPWWTRHVNRPEPSVTACARAQVRTIRHACHPSSIELNSLQYLPPAHISTSRSRRDPKIEQSERIKNSGPFRLPRSEAQRRWFRSRDRMLTPCYCSEMPSIWPNAKHSPRSECRDDPSAAILVELLEEALGCVRVPREAGA